jgi:branched-chain amino acid transport system substrate-binding protein
MRKNILLITVFFLLFLLASGCERQKSITPNGKKIKIGIIGPFSGPFSAQGQSGLEGIKAAIKVQPLLNDGVAIELVVEDDRDEPTQTIAALKKLTEIDKVSAILVFSDSASVLAMEPFVDRYKTPVIAILATHPDISKKSKYVTQLCFDDVFQGSVAALFVRDELLIDKVAIIDNPDNPYSTRLATEFRQKFTATGGKVSEVVRISDDVDDLSAIMYNLRSKETQLIYMPVKAECLIRIVKATHEIGWHPKMMGSDGLLATVLSRFRDDLVLINGLMATELFGQQEANIDYEYRLRKAFRSLFKHRPTSYSALGAEAYAVLCHALNHCREPENRQEINNKLRRTTNFNGISGKISITVAGKSKRALFVDTIENGHLQVIVKVY